MKCKGINDVVVREVILKAIANYYIFIKKITERNLE